MVLALGGAVLAAGGPGALLLAVAGVAFSATFHQAARGAAPGPRLDLTKPFTVLVMGTEKTQAFGGENTDSLMLMGYDPRASWVAVLSVPRDLWVDIPGEGYQRINTALQVGGPSLAEEVVTQVTGVPVDYYAVVTYQALVDVVNAVGGIEVYVPYNIDDTCFPNPAENACTTFRLSKGWHHLDGETALKLAREREVLPLSDLSRDADQQAILLALRQRLLTPFGLLKIPAIVQILARSVQTNFPLDQVPALASALLRLPRKDIHTAVLQYANGAVTSWVTPGGADVLLPNPSAIHAVVAQVFGPMLPGGPGT